MPAGRTAMCHMRGVLLLKFVGGARARDIARRIGMAPATVRTTIRRLQAAGAELGRCPTTWPTPRSRCGCGFATPKDFDSTKKAGSK
jgi:hypothetical protein